MVMDLLKGNHPVFNLFPFMEKIMYFPPFLGEFHVEKDLTESFCVLRNTLLKISCILDLLGTFDHNFCVLPC